MPKKHTIRRYIVPVVIIIISILFFISMIKSKPEPIQKEISERTWSIESLIVQKKNHKPVLQLYGEVISDMDIQLTASIEADVEQRLAKLGDTVKKGQLLLSLDKTRLMQLQLQRKAELNEIDILIKTEKQQFKTDTALLKDEKALLKIANNALKRAKTLEKSAMASNSQLDDARRTSIQQKLSIIKLSASLANSPARLAQLQAKHQQAQSRLALATDDLQQTQILSPIDGVITKVSVDNAEHVQKGAALFSITDTHNIEIQSLVPQTHYELLRQAFNPTNNLSNVSAVKAMVISNSVSLPAILSRLPANINKGQAGSFAFFKLSPLSNKTHSKKSPPPMPLLIGQTVTVYVELSPQVNTIALPHDAIYGTDSVFIIEQQRLKRVKVKWLGETFDDSTSFSEKSLSETERKNKKRILIRSDGINNNDEVLINKFANAMDGLKVKTANGDSPSE